jgi:DNA primase
LAAQRTGTDRQERALLGALLERPALLHALAEELAALPIANPELGRLRSGLLDALSLRPSGVDPAAEEALAGGSPEAIPLEARLIEDHLERSGLGSLAAASQAKAREVVRDDPTNADGWIDQWRRGARYLSQLASDLEELRRAEQALAEDLSEENLQWFRAISDRMRRESVETGNG